jgi:hypothetical protein
MLEIIKENVNRYTSFLAMERDLEIPRKKIKDICDKNKIDYSHFSYHKNKEEYVGKRYFNLTIISIYKKDCDSIRIGYRWYAHCKCACGNDHDCRLEAVTSGTTKSCGCLSKRRTCMDGSNNPAFNGISEIPVSWFKNYEYNALKRNIEWDLTLYDSPISSCQIASKFYRMNDGIVDLEEFDVLDDLTHGIE